MQTYLSAERVRELTQQLARCCESCDLNEVERILRLAEINAVKAYRQWLQSDNGFS